MPHREPKPTSDLDLKLDAGLVSKFEAHRERHGDLYPQAFETDEEVALYIRRNAIKNFPDDLEARDTAVQLALEVAYLDRSQVIIDGVVPLFKGDLFAPQDVAATADLPPAA